MKQLNVRISSNDPHTKDFGVGVNKMRLESPYLARTMKPGQFIEIRCSDSFEPLLRRPFGLHRILRSEIEILYEVVGPGTETLAKRKPGESLDIIGPLGKGFDLRTPNPEPRTPILVAGGMGVAPLVALAEALAKRKAKIYAVIGARTKPRLLCEDEFKKFGAQVLVATEDGSKGKKCLVTELLQNLLSEPRTPNPEPRIYACGPNAMLKEVARIAKSHRVSCQVSLEEYMACGVGVCLGCPVKVHSRIAGYEYKMVCKDGPVFNAEEIIW